MKIALDASAVPAQVAGAGRYVVEIARRLPHHGVDMTLVTRTHDEERWRDWSPDATVVPVIPDRRIARLLYEEWLLGTSAPSRAADVWHSPHYTMPHHRRGPTVVTIHDLTFFTNPEWHTSSKGPFFRRAIAYAAQHADVLISVSNFTARLLDDLVPNHAPVIVAPHGVDLDTFTTAGESDEAMLSAAGLPTDVPFIFFLGTFEPRKGLDVLLNAFEAVASEVAEVELWLAGQMGWGVEEFDRRVREHPASARIRRLGYVGEGVLPALLRQSQCVAYPSRGEGFGLPVLEALASGALVVTTADTVMAEVADGAAALARRGDAHDLARAIVLQIGRSAPDRAQAALRGRARAEQFTWDTSIDQHLIAYHLAGTGS